ncbi:glycosyltransferase [Euryarchaeota archaeon]|nr:glycosyltransferase [Euryarchaeota archaeon]
MGLTERHILFIPSWYPSSDAPLLGTFFQEQAEMFAEVGHKVGVLHARFHDLPSATWLKGPTEPITITEENNLTVVRARIRLFQPGPFHRIPPIYRSSIRAREKLALKMYDAYKEINGPPDIIHAKCTMCGAILARAIAERENIPYVVTVGASVFARGIVGPRERKTAAIALKSANRLLSVSSTLANDLERILSIHASEFTTVPNMIDPGKFPFTPLPKNETFTFGYMANLVEDKGHATLLQAFKEVPNAKLLLAGGGPLRKQLDQLTTALGIGDRVEFVGEISRERACEFFQQIDAFVHPSRYETFGIVLVEALSTGRPVIATRCGGPNDIIRSEDGLLVDVDDIDGLAEAMRNMIGMDWDTQSMRDGIEARYTKATIRRQLLEIYDTVL